MKRSEAQRRADQSKTVPYVKLCCEACEVSFYKPPSKASQRFCGQKCRYMAMVGENAPNARGGAWMRGEGNPNWKGGDATKRRKEWQRPAGKQARWRRRIFARDKYTCQRCHLSPKLKNQLRAHHIGEWAAFPDLRFEIANGVTLCVTCHKWVHGDTNPDREFLL